MVEFDHFKMQILVKNMGQKRGLSMHINELTNTNHTNIIDKIAYLLDMVSSETEIAYCPNNGDVGFIDFFGSDFSDEDDEDDEYLSGDYIRLPTQYEIHEYAMMEDFAEQYPDKKTEIALLNALHGRGAFRRFKDTLIYLGIREEWFTFRNREYREVAERWCVDNQLTENPSNN